MPASSTGCGQTHLNITIRSVTPKRFEPVRAGFAVLHQSPQRHDKRDQRDNQWLNGDECDHANGMPSNLRQMSVAHGADHVTHLEELRLQ